MAEVIVEYEDGHEETFQVKPKHLIAAERMLDQDLSKHSTEAMFVTAWKASKSPMKFNDWLDTVETVKQANGTSGDEDVDPTQDSSPDESPT